MSLEKPEFINKRKVEGEAESMEEFLALGGRILEYYPAEGDQPERPKTWICARDKKTKEPLDPPGFRKKAIHYLNPKGQWEAGNPTEELIQEKEAWQG